MSKPLELTGQKFGRLEVLSRYYGEKKYNSTYWECRCECDNDKILVVRSCDLTSGNTRSCGCNISKNTFYEKEDFMVCLSSQGKEIKFDKDDFDIVNKKTWSTSGRYAIAKHKNSSISMHSLIMNAQNGYIVDHINGDRFDNRKSNLRLCTNQHNQFNRQVSFGKSRFKGVSETHKNKTNPWRATIKKDKKTITIGTYKTEEEAAMAYDEKAKELFGGYCKLNFPDA